jgi:predicted flap endonuclease-1-like 5' DNA nuclease
MTDRTTIAAMALQGLLTNRDLDKVEYHELAGMAVAHADCLIQELGGLPEPSQGAAASPVGPVGDASPDLRDLGVSGRAAAPLERMGVSTLAQLAVQARSDIAQVKGVSTQTMKQLDRLLTDNGLSWDWTPGDAPGPVVSDDNADDETETVSDEDDLEDVL